MLETNTEDLPFLVDSVSAELRRAAWASCACCTRSSAPSARPTAASPASCIRSGAPATESVMHFELDRRLAPEELADLEDAVRSVLADVRRVVRDFPPLRERVEPSIDVARAGAERYDGRRGGRGRRLPANGWRAGNFIFLGARDYELRDGALRSSRAPASGCSPTRRARPSPSRWRSRRWTPALRERALGGDLLLVSKTNRLSPVHRRARMDYVGIRRVSDDGEIVGEAR